MSKKIFIGNYKGGVGKTTSVFSIAINLAKNHGKKVLLLDIDPQSSLSEICLRNYGKDLNELRPYETLNYIFDVYIHKIKTSSSIDLSFNLKKMIKNVNNTVDFIPSSLFYKRDKQDTYELGLDELALLMEHNIEYLSILKRFTDFVDKECEYDYIFIDCPPTSNVITQGAFLMSDYYAIPTIVDGMSSNGIVHYIERINKTYSKFCKDDTNAILNKHIFGFKPKLIGIFYTLTDKRVNYNNAKKDLANGLKEQSHEKDIYIFKSSINDYVDIARKIAEGELSDKKGSDYANLSGEFNERLDRM